MTAPDVVADDCEPEHGGLEQSWSDPQIVKLADVAGFIPRLVAVSVYPKPGWLIDRLENEATPRLVSTVVVPDSVPEPGFAVGVMATVMAAFEFVTSCPDASRTSTLTGPGWELKAEVIVALTAVLAGCPSAVNASEHGLDRVQPPDSHATAGAADINAQSMLAASTPKSARVAVETALLMAATFVYVNCYEG